MVKGSTKAGIWCKKEGFGPETENWDTHIVYNPVERFYIN